MKKNNKKIIENVINSLILAGVLLIIGVLIYNLFGEQIYIHRQVKPKYLTQEDKEIQIMEVISEKVYNAYIEKDLDKVNSFSTVFGHKSALDVNDTASKIKVDADKVDAKALEIYKFSKNFYRITVEFKDEEDLSYEMDGKKISMVVKLNRKKGTFKILDMEVGVQYEKK